MAAARLLLPLLLSTLLLIPVQLLLLLQEPWLLLEPSQAQLCRPCFDGADEA
jgi:hypothetical protein